MRGSGCRSSKDPYLEADEKMASLFGGSKNVEVSAPNEGSSLVQGKGPKDLEERKCTDCLCLLFFGAFWVGMLTLTTVVFTLGDANKIFYGVDYLGNTCGNSANTTGKPKIFYPRIAQDVLEQASTVSSAMFWDVNLYGVCVESCPTYSASRVDTVTDYGYGQSADAQAASWTVYLSTIDLFNRCIPATESSSVSIDLCTLPNCTEVGATCYSLGSGSTVQAPAGSWALDGTVPASSCAREIVFSYGSTVSQPGATAYLDWLFASVSQIRDTWESLWNNMGAVLVFGVLCAVLINFVWLVLLYFFAGIAVWTCVILVLVSTLCGTIFCLIKAGATTIVTTAIANSTVADMGINLTAVVTTAASDAIGDVLAVADTSTQWIYWVGAVCSGIAFLAFFITICCGFKAIGRCIVLVQQGSLAIAAAPSLALLPLLIAALQLALIVYVALTIMVMTTLGTDGTYAARVSSGYSATQLDMFIGTYLLFGGVWGYAFLTALELMVIAACIFYFYFVNKKTVPAGAYMAQYDDNQTSNPVLTHLGWVLRYHVGTIAFGSLIVAVVTMIQLATRAVFTYLEHNTPGGQNFAVKLAQRCIECCLWCFKKTIEFVNSYAYIYCFVENIGFCNGCVKTFSLILRYPAQIAINTSVQLVLSTLLTLTTPLVCALLAFIYFDFAHADEHTGAGGMLLPGAVLVLALLMSRAFASVWEQTIQSLTVCVLHDVDNYDGRFLRESMMNVFGNPTKNAATVPKDDKKEALISK